MTNSSVSKKLGNSQSVDGSLLLLTTNSSPVKGKPKSARSPPRGKCHQDNQPEREARVRFGSGSHSPSPRGSPNGKMRGSPSKSPRQSPTCAELYAGFVESPAPAALPKPPSHWMKAIHFMTARQSCHQEVAAGFANNIKFLLNAQA